MAEARAFVWENCYWDADLEREVWFGDYYDENTPRYRYYLFYDFGEKSFHTPMIIRDAEMYADIPRIEIDEIVTHGDDIHDLISVQFVKKVIRLIEEGEYTYKG